MVLNLEYILHNTYLYLPTSFGNKCGNILEETSDTYCVCFIPRRSTSQNLDRDAHPTLGV